MIMIKINLNKFIHLVCFINYSRFYPDFYYKIINYILVSP